MKSGIELVKRDIRQPYRVWWDSYIVWFAKTPTEANDKLKEAMKREIVKVKPSVPVVKPPIVIRVKEKRRKQAALV